jgi:DNA-binding PadR family transcriptional regulator
MQEGIEQDGGPEKRIYSITPTGQVELENWFTSGVEREHHRDEFFIKLMLSLVTGEATPYQVIRLQRASLYRELHALTTQRNQANQHSELAKIFLFDKAIMHLEADLRWLDMVEARLDEIKRQPLPEPEAKPRGRPRKKQVDG